jgi:hypothetical protein
MLGGMQGICNIQRMGIIMEGKWKGNIMGTWKVK